MRGWRPRCPLGRGGQRPSGVGLCVQVPARERRAPRVSAPSGAGLVGTSLPPARPPDHSPSSCWVRAPRGAYACALASLGPCATTPMKTSVRDAQAVGPQPGVVRCRGSLAVCPVLPLLRPAAGRPARCCPCERGLVPAEARPPTPPSTPSCPPPGPWVPRRPARCSRWAGHRCASLRWARSSFLSPVVPFLCPNGTFLPRTREIPGWFSHPARHVGLRGLQRNVCASWGACFTSYTVEAEDYNFKNIFSHFSITMYYNVIDFLV